MIGSSFFRSNKEKCPNCGSFGNDMDADTDLSVDGSVCPSCSTRFNEYLILQDGEDIEFKNN